jgi:hypothetical protein
LFPLGPLLAAALIAYREQSTRSPPELAELGGLPACDNPMANG